MGGPAGPSCAKIPCSRELFTYLLCIYTLLMQCPSYGAGATISDMRFTIFASTIVLSISSAVRGVSLPKRWNTSGSYLDQAGLTANNKAVFDIGMQVLDSNFGLPLLYASVASPIYAHETGSRAQNCRHGMQSDCSLDKPTAMSTWPTSCSQMLSPCNTLIQAM